MKREIPLLLLAFTLLFTACKKEESVDTPTTNTGGTTGTGGGTKPDTANKVKTYTEKVSSPIGGLDSSVTYNLTYDANGRLISIVSKSNPGDKFIYAYPSSSKFTADLYLGNALSSHEDYYVNSGFFEDSTFQYDDAQDSVTEKYFYNTANQLLKLKQYDITDGMKTLYNITDYVYNSDGDLVSSTDASSQVTTYTYYTNISYAQAFFAGFANANNKKKSHPIKDYTVTVSGLELGKISATYAFDTLNRISIENFKVTQGSDITYFSKSYTYY